MIRVSQETVDGVWQGELPFSELVSETDKIIVECRACNPSMTEHDLICHAIEGISEGWELDHEYVLALRRHYAKGLTL